METQSTSVWMLGLLLGGYAGYKLSKKKWWGALAGAAVGGNVSKLVSR